MDGEDQGASAHESDDEWGDDIDGDGLRGWIPPDDRLWRHPSESAGLSSLAPRPVAPPRSGPRDRTGPWVVGGATACLILALVAAGLVVATTNGPDGRDTSPSERISLTDVPTTEAGAGRVPSPPTVAAMMARIRPSTVALIIRSANGVSVATGLVVASGGMVVTTSRAIAAARSITAVEQGGDRAPATKVGFDRPTGISVLNIGDDLAPAPSDFTGPARGAVAVAMAFEPGSRAGAPPTSIVYAGKVVAAGVALGLDSISSTFAAFGVEAPLSSSDVGCPLLDAEGQVVGVLERAGGVGLASASTFLPAELVWGVADQLVSAGGVDPGWMGVTTADAMAPSIPPTPVGAMVDAVAGGSPAAAGGIQPGDVVTAVDGFRVRSQAELRTLLYTEPTGTEVTVSLERAGSHFDRRVVLAGAGPDAPEAAPSP